MNHTSRKAYHNLLLHLLQREEFFLEMHIPHPQGLSRWHTIRSPKVWQIEQSFRSTKDQILKERFDCSSTSGSRNFSDIVTELRPFERWIGPRNDMPRSNSLHYNVEDGSYLIDKLDAEGNYSEEDEDVIEDW